MPNHRTPHSGGGNSARSAAPTNSVSCSLANMWMLRALWLLSLFSACVESKNASVEHVADEPEAPHATAADAGLRVKPRLVTIELPRVVHRTLEEAEDGSVAWSAPEEIDDAITCVIERRDAYSPFEPFDAIVPPICVTTPAGELPRLSEVPADSDLTVTVSKDGYLPAVRSLRVESGDVFLPSSLPLELTVLFERAQADLFLPVPGHAGPATSRDAGLGDAASANAASANAGATEAEPGRIAFEVDLGAFFPHVPYPDGQTLLFHGPDGLLASGGS